MTLAWPQQMNSIRFADRSSIKQIAEQIWLISPSALPTSLLVHITVFESRMGLTACSGYQSNAVAIGDVKYGNCNTVVTVIK
jgi:hypothetical protein